jgi:hypothetical protein
MTGQDVVVGRAPRRDTRTYLSTHRGEEVYSDTGRPVDEWLGTHVVLWIVEDPEAWAAAVEAEGDAEPALWPKKRRHIGEARRLQRYEDAAQIRAKGARRDWDTVGSETQAAATVAGLRRAHPNPGVRYEMVPIETWSACPDPECATPTVFADGHWAHHIGRYPAECPRPAERLRKQEAAAVPPRQDGEFEIDAGMGTMTCGYCNEVATWPHAVLGYARLTGFHLLGVFRETNTLVVLAEATSLTGATVYLPHHCLAIPAEAHAEHAPGTVLARPEATG